MKHIIALIFLLTSCAHAAQPFIAIGDSITASHNSWANVLRDDGTRVRLLAQSGRTIRDYEIPRDLQADGNYRKVIYFLGANDAMQATPSKVLRQRFRAHVRLLRDRGFALSVIVPPEFPFLLGPSRRVRGVLFNECQRMRLRCHDIGLAWDYDLTTDTVHPTTAGHIMLADYIEALEGKDD